MPSPADVFVATPEVASTYTERALTYEIRRMPNRVEYFGIDALELGFLWAMLAGEEWDVKKHMLTELHFGTHSDAGLMLFPPDFVALLANIDDANTKKVAEDWSRIVERRDADKKWAARLLKDLIRLARKSRKSNMGLYLWSTF